MSSGGLTTTMETELLLCGHRPKAGFRGKLHYTDTSNEHHQRTSSPRVVDVVQHVTNSTTRTPATDTTNGQAHKNSTTNLPHRNARATCQDVGMWQIFVRWWCSLVVFVAGVRSRCPCSGVWLLGKRTSATNSLSCGQRLFTARCT